MMGAGWRPPQHDGGCDGSFFIFGMVANITNLPW